MKKIEKMLKDRPIAKKAQSYIPVHTDCLSYVGSYWTCRYDPG